MSRVIYEVRKNEYYDSVTLMLISKELTKLDGVHEALVGMGTGLNKELAENLNLSNEEIVNATANDFFVTVLADENIDLDRIRQEVDDYLQKRSSEGDDDYSPPTLRSALEHQPNSNMVLISVAGEYAADEVRKALDNNLHVMLFSDNVSIEDEKELKETAVKKGLLMMGPDCGTAIINNVPLAFANVVSKGDIGIVGASGTGTQEVTVIIDRLGGGVSQVIGTGGRDLSEQIGGLMMLQGIEALIDDPDTKVIMLVSKPPSKTVAEKMYQAIQNIDKPVVVDFIGGDPKAFTGDGIYGAYSLEDASRKAVALSKGEPVVDFLGFSEDEDVINRMVEEEVAQYAPDQKYFRGFYTGGTLASEAMDIIGKVVDGIYSNVSKDPAYKLKDNHISQKNTVVDFGEDEFTVGRPHPMIEPGARNDRLNKEGKDTEMAVILMDFVIGYGCNADPVGETLNSLHKVQNMMKDAGKHLTVVASICGTDKDPQNLKESAQKLKDNGVIVFPTNGQAAKFVAKIMEKLQ